MGMADFAVHQTINHLFSVINLYVWYTPASLQKIDEYVHTLPTQQQRVHWSITAMSRPRVLVTGGSGYLGQFLILGLAERFEVLGCGATTGVRNAHCT